MEFEPSTPFEAVVCEKLGNIEKRLDNFHSNLYSDGGIEPRVRNVEMDCNGCVKDVEELKKNQPRVYWLVGLASLIGGFIGRLFPWGSGK